MRPASSRLVMLTAAAGLFWAGTSEAFARGGAVSGGFAGARFAGRPAVGFRAGHGAFGRHAGFLRFDGRRFRGLGHGPYDRFGYGRRPGHGYGEYGGYGLGGYGYGGYGYGGLYGGVYGTEGGYASPRLPLPREPGLPVAAGIPAPAVQPPAIYVIGRRSAAATGIGRMAGRRSSGVVAATSNDVAGESGVVSSGPRVTRLR
jgi:hypothetical protein